MALADDIAEVEAAITSVLDNGQTIRSEDYLLQKAKLSELIKRQNSLVSQNTDFRDRTFRIIPDRTN